MNDQRLKADAGKPRLELLAYPWLEGVARVLTYGASKYSAWCWADGMDWSRLIGGMHRHLGAWSAGEDLDPETGESHLLHLACGCMMAWMHQRYGLGRDDRKTWQTQSPPPVGVDIEYLRIRHPDWVWSASESGLSALGARGHRLVMIMRRDGGAQWVVHTSDVADGEISYDAWSGTE
jgi:hypothetical protein